MQKELLTYQPHAYQQFAADFILSHPVACLMLDMGLGKTVITLTALRELLARGEVRRVLVIAPLRVARDQWPAELNKWEHLRGLSYAVATGNRAQRLAALKNKAAQLVLLNRENVAWLAASGQFDFDMVVIDELSGFKSHRTRRFKALLQLRPQLRRIVGLTGTPASNGLLDLWAQFRLLDFGQRLGRFLGAYQEQYFVPDRASKDRVFSYRLRQGAEEKIYAAISDITISMRSREYLRLPPCIVRDEVVQLSAPERSVYKRLQNELALQVQGRPLDKFAAGAISGKLLQLANGAVYDRQGQIVTVHDRKLEALEDMVEAANGRPLLVAYWFKHDKERIMARLPARELATSEDMAAWNAGEIPVALIHPAAAGHGLNLQAGGALLVWFGLTWSLELYQQTNARLYRQGQRHTVIIRHIITKDTIDEDVLRALRAKDKTQQSLLEAVRVRLRA